MATTKKPKKSIGTVLANIVKTGNSDGRPRVYSGRHRKALPGVSGRPTDQVVES